MTDEKIELKVNVFTAIPMLLREAWEDSFIPRGLEKDPHLYNYRKMLYIMHKLSAKYITIHNKHLWYDMLLGVGISYKEMTWENYQALINLLIISAC